MLRLPPVAALTLCLGATAGVSPGFAQEPAQEPAPGPEQTPESKSVLTRIDARFGFLVTGGDTFTDRPFIQIDAGPQFGRPRPGGPPALALTLGLAIGAGEIFAESVSESLRLLFGVELPWAVAGPETGTASAEIVPVLQAGYMTSIGEDERAGFMLRAALGLRLPVTSGPLYLTFEPASLVLLPDAELLGFDSGPSPDAGSRVAWELGVLKVGWRF